MVILNEKEATELCLRVVLESDEYGREYFDNYDSVGEIFQAVQRLVTTAAEESAEDGIERTVSIAIVPKGYFGNEGSHGYGLKE